MGVLKRIDDVKSQAFIYLSLSIYIKHLSVALFYKLKSHKSLTGV